MHGINYGHPVVNSCAVCMQFGDIQAIVPCQKIMSWRNNLHVFASVQPPSLIAKDVQFEHFLKLENKLLNIIISFS